MKIMHRTKHDHIHNVHHMISGGDSNTHAAHVEQLTHNIITTQSPLNTQKPGVKQLMTYTINATTGGSV